MVYNLSIMEETPPKTVLDNNYEKTPHTGVAGFLNGLVNIRGYYSKECSREKPKSEMFSRFENVLLICFGKSLYDIARLPVGYKQIEAYYDSDNGHCHRGMIFKESEDVMVYEFSDYEIVINGRNYKLRFRFNLESGETEKFNLFDTPINFDPDVYPFEDLIDAQRDSNKWIKVIPKNQNLIQERNRVMKASPTPTQR
jgi:hypothetical protein